MYSFRWPLIVTEVTVLSPGPALDRQLNFLHSESRAVQFWGSRQRFLGCVHVSFAWSGIPRIPGAYRTCNLTKAMCIPQVEGMGVLSSPDKVREGDALLVRGVLHSAESRRAVWPMVGYNLSQQGFSTAKDSLEFLILSLHLPSPEFQVYATVLDF